MRYRGYLVGRIYRYGSANRSFKYLKKISFRIGDPMFRHVKAIVKGKGNSLLTLPKNLLKKLSGYLGIFDVLNLCAVSRIANEVRKIPSLQVELWLVNKDCNHVS